MREAIELAQAFVDGYDEAAFTADRKTVFAVVRCLEIISEASRRLDEAVKSRHPSLPWTQIAAAGNVYRHQYDNVLETYVWTTLRESLAPLLAAIRQELG